MYNIAEHMFGVVMTSEYTIDGCLRPYRLTSLLFDKKIFR
jgi:hypothetical protein